MTDMKADIKTAIDAAPPAVKRITQAAYDKFRRAKHKPLRPVDQIGDAERAALGDAKGKAK